VSRINTAYLSDTFILVGFDVLTSVTVKIIVLWDVMACSVLEVYQCFGGTYCLHLQGQRLSQASNQHIPGDNTLHT
jgi:hypothetical protein